MRRLVAAGILPQDQTGMKIQHKISLACTVFAALIIAIPAYTQNVQANTKKNTDVVHLKLGPKNNNSKNKKPPARKRKSKTAPEPMPELIPDSNARNIPENGLAPHPLPEGFVQPYSYANLMRQYDGNRCRHRGIDIGTTGQPYGGLGTPVLSVTKAKVVFIGRSMTNAREFGRPDKRSGNATRSGTSYPRKINIPKYGIVYPFTRNYGKWRSGNVISTVVEGGIIDGYTIRYMHLAEVNPDLKVGSILQPGDEVGLMGSTAIQDSCPHVHIDMENKEKKRVDLGPYIGLEETAKKCRAYTPTPLSDPDAYNKYINRVKQKNNNPSAETQFQNTKSRPYQKNIHPEKTALKSDTIPQTRTILRPPALNYLPPVP